MIIATRRYILFESRFGPLFLDRLLATSAIEDLDSRLETWYLHTGTAESGNMEAPTNNSTNLI